MSINITLQKLVSTGRSLFVRSWSTASCVNNKDININNCFTHSTGRVWTNSFSVNMEVRCCIVGIFTIILSESSNFGLVQLQQESVFSKNADVGHFQQHFSTYVMAKLRSKSSGISLARTRLACNQQASSSQQ